MILLAALAFGYFLGSIPFGLLLTRLAGLGDVRSIGSGNIGATNVLRTGNRSLAAATLFLDALKGALAVILAERFGIGLGILAGFGAFVGHLFPIWLGFKGGKGVATYLGALLPISPIAALAFTVIWLATAFLTRYSSLSALIACMTVPIALLMLGFGDASIVFSLMSLLVFWKHRANIQRLMAGDESRIGRRG